ncbi:hypothetical protein [Nocardia sp. NPDC004750]
MLAVAVGGGVVDSEGVGDDRCRCLQDELPQGRDAAGDGGDAGLGGLLAEGFGPERLAGGESKTVLAKQFGVNREPSTPSCAPRP